MNSINLLKKMDNRFMDSENSKISDTYRQLLNLLEKMNLKRRNKYVALSNYTWKNIRK